jgi:hypothetical protein
MNNILEKDPELVIRCKDYFYQKNSEIVGSKL